ncbi:M20 family metallo-hydrolase [Megamonas hypermegale]|uniref:M20 family metallo-hydrolase n=1 Tax=Megamonas hypermegale TaxID=158847 RepID=UPI0025A41305|nr:M20 family metallo-hydrolase [Megamonas hypermegale]MDM8143998.1 M20 family metallo-hydrolase [Megamonas hypermegale]
MKIKVNTGNIKMWLETINTFNSTPDFGTTRVLFTDEEVKAREYVKSEMRKLNLQVHEDAIGNIFGVLEGTRPDLPPVWTGSHIDTVLNAGMFDGMSGVVAGLEAVRLIQVNKLKHERSIVVVVYTSEEPTRFKVGCLGSRAMAGKLDAEAAKKLVDDGGNTLYDVLQKLGFPVQDFDKVPVKKGSIYAAVELHIDQNGVLEKAGKPIGIVKTICAPSVFEVEVIGRQSHAGGTTMKDRQDAFMATAEIALALEQLGRTSQSEYTTVTIGRVQVIPNAVNVIPGKVVFSIDIRDCDYDYKNDLIAKLKNRIKEIADKRNVKVNLTQYNNDYPMKCDENIIKKLENACEKENTPYIKTISGAFHDSMLVGEFAPVAMIFVPSKNGISHSPEEWTNFADIAAGTDVLADTLIELANEI